MAKPEITVVPANEATAEQLDAIFGTRGDVGRAARRYSRRRRVVGDLLREPHRLSTTRSEPGLARASVGFEQQSALSALFLADQLT